MDKRFFSNQTFHFLTIYFINFDHGILPACIKRIQLDLEINEIQLGLLSSSVYAGIIIGSMIGTGMYDKYKTKSILIICSLFYILNSLQDFIYFPIWIDRYGGKQKDQQLIYIQIGVPLGTISGFLISSLSLQILQDWKYAIYFQIVALTLCLLYYGFSDNNIFSIQIQEERDQSQSFSTVLLQNCKTFFSNPLFVLSMLALCQLFFVLTGVQFWITDYLNSVMLMEYNLASQSFLIISITAPLSGVYLGSQILDNEGGNKGFRIMKITAIELCLASISLALIPLFDNQGIIVLLVWCLIFFGSSAIPSLMGIMITSLQREEKTCGNQLSHLFLDFFGYLPASTVYGYVQQISGGSTSRKGMVMLSCICFLGLIFLLLGIYKKYNQIRLIYIDLNESEFKNKLRSLSHHSGDNMDDYEKKDFSYIRMQTASKKFKQIIFPHYNDQIEGDQLSENESPLIIGMETQRIRNAYRSQCSYLHICYNVSSIIGRRSLENDLFMIKDDQLQIKLKSQNSFQLQVIGANHLICEERVVHQQQY
ncbi:unnamed protein product [Paramecium pentaurelia]|uniref:Major facilitator superfamily (MFS) profile domain-containing protein n=1 Tax=Paramecium pentaurelia TaxID=43138 RepID=A0A8S1SQR8_9CILI|nr:unnamed protein product [Paramecium pentaurelia]